MVTKSRENRYNVLITTRHEKKTTEIIFIEGINREVYYQTIFEIITCTNYKTNNCHYGQERRLLPCKSSVKAVESNDIKRMK